MRQLVGGVGQRVGRCGHRIIRIAIVLGRIAIAALAVEIQQVIGRGQITELVQKVAPRPPRLRLQVLQAPEEHLLRP